VEREGEPAALEAAFVEVSGGRARLVLVTAEAGGRQTALIERFCADQAGSTSGRDSRGVGDPADNGHCASSYREPVRPGSRS